MSLTETKLELVQIILQTEETELLEQVRQILSPVQDDWWDIISIEDKQAIEEGVLQAERGEHVSHEAVIKMVNDHFKQP